MIALTEPPSHKVIINVIEGMEGEKTIDKTDIVSSVDGK